MLPAVFLLAAIIFFRLAPWLGGPEAVQRFTGYMPLMGYALCGGIFLSRRIATWFPVVAVVVTHGIINVLCDNRDFLPVNNRYAMIASAFAIMAVILVSAAGVSVKKKASAGLLFGTVFASTVLFYLVSNTVSFFTDPAYEFSLRGWMQAVTTGRPGIFPPAWVFLLRSLAGNMAFTALFYALCRKSLREPGTVPAATEAEPALAS